MEINLDDLADMLSVIADGGIILSKTIKDKHVLARQMLLYRDFRRQSADDGTRDQDVAAEARDKAMVAFEGRARRALSEPVHVSP